MVSSERYEYFLWKLSCKIARKTITPLIYFEPFIHSAFGQVAQIRDGDRFASAEFNRRETIFTINKIKLNSVKIERGGKFEPIPVFFLWVIQNCENNMSSYRSKLPLLITFETYVHWVFCQQLCIWIASIFSRLLVSHNKSLLILSITSNGSLIRSSKIWISFCMGIRVFPLRVVRNCQNYMAF